MVFDKELGHDDDGRDDSIRQEFRTQLIMGISQTELDEGIW